MAEEHYFTRTGTDTYAPTINCEGAWSPEDYHFAALAGLVVHVAERCRPEGDTKKLARVSYDILGRLPLEEARVSVETLRPGKKIELVEVTVELAGRPAVVARIWYLAPQDTADVADPAAQTFPLPDECDDQRFSDTWDGGYIRQLTGRKVTGLPEGEFFAWFTSPTRIVDADERIALAEYFSRIDTANGVTAKRSPREWAFPNVDLTVHMYRHPEGEWTGLEASNRWGPAGAGVTSTTLHDLRGPLGRVEQMQALAKL
ncbi:thioesterase family protein [Corynebacterium sp. UBA2622]|uniref:thioesterase family protein n=1 Tax=Corynebacterium sp. UBA2622 TaxID=1946393 RepID=UPI0025C1064F|nr:thioesterase family protein [Corynebacterium sp. UBA2622]